MNKYQLVAKFLDLSTLKDKMKDCKAICAISGEPISTGIPKKIICGDTFPVHFIKHESDFVSVEVAICFYEYAIASSNAESKRSHNPLRNYSFICTKNEFKLLQRDELLLLILNAPKEPFLFIVTYSHKKHILPLANINYSNKNFIISTDESNVSIELERVYQILPTLQSWYTVIKGKEGAKQEPTYFTKEDILSGCSDMRRIKEYGTAKYFQENQLLMPYRNTDFLKLLVHSLNKSYV